MHIHIVTMSACTRKFRLQVEDLFAAYTFWFDEESLFIGKGKAVGTTGDKHWKLQFLYVQSLWIDPSFFQKIYPEFCLSPFLFLCGFELLTLTAINVQHKFLGVYLGRQIYWYLWQNMEKVLSYGKRKSKFLISGYLILFFPLP